MSGPSLKKTMDSYTSEDFIDLSQQDFMTKFLKDNRGVADIGPESLKRYAKDYSNLRATRIEERRAGKQKTIEKEQEELVKILTARPGRSQNILT